MLLVGSLLFASMSFAAIVDAVRAEPLRAGDLVVATNWEAVSFRVAAALLCALVAGWLFALARPEGKEMELPR